MSVKSTATHFGRVARWLHWTTAVLILALLITGIMSDEAQSTGKAAFLRWHMPIALLALLLTVFRLFWWWRLDRKPAPLASIPHWQEALAKWTHRLLYLAILLMLGSGIALSAMSGAPDAVFGTAAMPDFQAYPPRQGHGALAFILVALICLHAGAALFHHFVQKDDTLRRMWR